MPADAGESGGGAARERGLGDYPALARVHGETSDTRRWVADLEDPIRVAWDLLTAEQKPAFCAHPDVLALQEAAGEVPEGS